MKNTLDISTNTLLRTALIVLIIWFIFAIKNVLLLLFISIILVSALEPLVDNLQKKKVPRVLGALIIYAVFFSFIFSCLYLIFPIFIFELKQLGENIPRYFSDLNLFLTNLGNLAANSNLNLDIQGLINNISNRLTETISRIFSNSISFLVSLFEIIIVFSLSFYMTVKKNGIKGFLEFLLPEKHKIYAIDLTQRIQSKMGNWLIGQLTIAFIVFGLEFLVLSLLGVPYALLLAIIGGFFEIIPYIGPFISIIPAVLIGYTISPFTAVLIAILYIIIQQLENNVFTPLVMKKAVGLDPVVIIVSLITGATLFGFMGLLIAIPFATALSVLVKDIQNDKFLK